MLLTRRCFIKFHAAMSLFLVGCGGSSNPQSITDIEDTNDGSDPDTSSNLFALTDINGNQLLTFDGLILEVLRP